MKTNKKEEFIVNQKELEAMRFLDDFNQFLSEMIESVENEEDFLENNETEVECKHEPQKEAVFCTHEESEFTNEFVKEETENEILYKVDVTQFPKENIEVEYLDVILSVNATNIVKTNAGEKIINMQGVIALPEGVTKEQIEANVNMGILEIVIKKPKLKKDTTRIMIL